MGGNALRLTCKALREAASNAPWVDAETRIRSRVGAWRAAYPLARAANVFGQEWLCDADFVHFRGLHTLDMSYCDQYQNIGFQFLLFLHVPGFETLGPSDNTASITDAAFVHLAGIRKLDISYCNQAGITDTAFTHLAGIRELTMEGCDQESITADAFAPFATSLTSSLSKLNVYDCSADVRNAALALRDSGVDVSLN